MVVRGQHTSIFVMSSKQASHNGPITIGSSSANDPKMVEHNIFTFSAANWGVCSHTADARVNMDDLICSWDSKENIIAYIVPTEYVFNYVTINYMGCILVSF